MPASRLTLAFILAVVLAVAVWLISGKREVQYEGSRQSALAARIPPPERQKEEVIRTVPRRPGSLESAGASRSEPRVEVAPSDPPPSEPRALASLPRHAPGELSGGAARRSRLIGKTNPLLRRKDENRDLQSRAIEPPSRLMTPAELEAAAEIAALHDQILLADDAAARADAAFDLSTYDDERAIAALKDALRDPDPEVRIEALDQLAWMLDELPRDVLSAALGDSDPAVRLAALDAVWQVEDESVRSLVRKVVNDPDEDVRDEARSLLDLD